MLLALQGISQANQAMFVGFDYNDALAAALQCKRIEGLVAQDPFRMGEVGVQSVVEYLKGHEVAKRVDTGAILVTPENLTTHAIQSLLNPPMPEERISKKQLIELQRSDQAIFLHADADGTRGTFCRQRHFDPSLLASCESGNLGVFGDEDENGLL